MMFGIIVGPVAIGATIAVGWWQIGPSVLAGVSFTLVMIPIQTALGRRFGRARAATVRQFRHPFDTLLVHLSRVSQLYAHPHARTRQGDTLSVVPVLTDNYVARSGVRALCWYALGARVHRIKPINR